MKGAGKGRRTGGGRGEWERRRLALSYLITDESGLLADPACRAVLLQRPGAAWLTGSGEQELEALLLLLPCSSSALLEVRSLLVLW